MEVNSFGDTILPAVVVEDVVEGRMVLLTSHSFDTDYGSQTDLPGCVRPRNTTEASRARYCIAFAEDNRSLPIYQPQPHYDWALREGWEQTANSPFAADNVYLTHPGNMECQTIPSGSSVKLFGEGLYTVLSGCYMHSAEVEVPGMPLTVANVGDDGNTDAGKLKYSASNVVAEVFYFDTSNSKLTFKILH